MLTGSSSMYVKINIVKQSTICIFVSFKQCMRIFLVPLARCTYMPYHVAV